MSFKDIVITPTEINDFPDHIVRSFHVTRMGQAVERVVKQFHYTSWPDFGVPQDPSAILTFMRKVNNWKGISQGPMVRYSNFLLVFFNQWVFQIHWYP